MHFAPTAIAIGAVLAIAAAIYARAVGLDRERAFYTTVLCIVGLFYGLFTVVAGVAAAWEDGWWRTLALESTAIAAFFVLAALGFRRSQWIIVAGLAAHGVYDVFHHHLIDNPGIPHWWPAFCASYDLTAAACLAVLIRSRR
ncbi:MAG TPA: hypothetical protein VD997_08330 [Phycisphaerales bacterium]|nr:hypothetical protein [Phycisphaerales bacterium]